MEQEHGQSGASQAIDEKKRDNGEYNHTGSALVHERRGEKKVAKAMPRVPDRKKQREWGSNTFMDFEGETKHTHKKEESRSRSSRQLQRSRSPLTSTSHTDDTAHHSKRGSEGGRTDSTTHTEKQEDRWHALEEGWGREKGAAGGAGALRIAPG